MVVSHVCRNENIEAPRKRIFFEGLLRLLKVRSRCTGLKPNFNHYHNPTLNLPENTFDTQIQIICFTIFLPLKDNFKKLLSS
jgi:hypothetical protein